MALFDFLKTKQEIPKDQLNEALKPFEDRLSKSAMLKIARKRSGEGIEDFSQMGSAFGAFGVETNFSNLNNFYKKFIDTAVKDAQERIIQYRNIAQYPEIAEVIEDIINESTQVDNSGRILQLTISDPELAANSNMSKTIVTEFYDLFYHRIQIQKKIDQLLYNYYVDSKVFWENIIDVGNPRKGIINIKPLATETMDYSWNPFTGKMNFFVQYTKPNGRMPVTFEEALASPDSCIAFHPKQITFLDYGFYGIGGKKDVIGYLEKVKQPFNQLKLIESSVVIYRLIRAPERLVFKIDTGNMPLDRAMRFVESMKRSLQQKVMYDPNTGQISNQPNVVSVLDNFFLPSSSSGRGSSVESVGGNPSGFAELDDLHYFQKKLYRALKYPMSRVEHIFEQQAKEIRVADSSGEIVRDETKWGRFLKKHQDKFSEAFLDVFMLHLEFKGLKKEFGIKRDMLQVSMTVPNDFIGSMKQVEFDRRWSNYDKSDKPEFSKYWRMKRILKLTDEEIQENVDMLKKDRELGLTPDEQDMYGR